MTEYDQVRYPGHAYAHTHPEHLYVLGRLHGMSPVDPARCRVLEIGCGDGANLVPMAWQSPGSRFVGFDLAETSIATGREMIRAMGLSNLELHQMDLMDLPDSAGPFDYIIAHGFYSWVPAVVRERMLALAGKLLSSQGIAFVSYNAYPGGHLRNLVREMVLFHVNHAPDPATKVEQARAFLGFLGDGIANLDEHGRLLKAEVARVREFDPAHFFHDDLAAINQSFYLHEFVAQAAAHGLQYLSDADFPSTQDSRMPPDVRETLGQLSGRPVLKAQYLDFLKFRRFSQTLLCHEDVRLERHPGPASMREFFTCGIIETVSGRSDEWRSPRGARMRSGHPVAQAAFAAIGKRWPGRWDFASLTDAVLQEAGGSRDTVGDVLAKVLWEAFTVGMIDAYPARESFALKPSEKPVASELARHQLTRGNSIVTLLHGTVGVGDATGRLLISLLDGTRDREALVAAMAESALLREQEPDKARRLTIARESADAGLERLAHLALLTD
jgi:methyltransferase-like protein